MKGFVGKIHRFWVLSGVASMGFWTFLKEGAFFLSAVFIVC